MTPLGKQWQKIVLDGRQRMALEQKKIEDELRALQGLSPPKEQTKVKESTQQQELPQHTESSTMDEFLNGMDVDQLLADDLEGGNEEGTGNLSTAGANDLTPGTDANQPAKSDDKWLIQEMTPHFALGIMTSPTTHSYTYLVNLFISISKFMYVS